MKFLASASLRRSAGMGTILRPVSLAISAAAASSGSLRRAQMATSTPSLRERQRDALADAFAAAGHQRRLALSLRSIAMLL